MVSFKIMLVDVASMNVSLDVKSDSFTDNQNCDQSEACQRQTPPSWVNRLLPVLLQNMQPVPQKFEMLGSVMKALHFVGLSKC